MSPQRKNGGPNRGRRFGCLGFMAMLAFAGVGVLFALWGYASCVVHAVVQERELATFVPVPGVVVQSEVRGYVSRRGHTFRAPYILYHYTAQGLTFESDTLYPGEELPVVGNFLVKNGRHYQEVVSAATTSGAGAVVAAHPVSKAVTVYCDPAAPARSFLIARMNRGAYIFGLTFALGLWATGMGLISIIRHAGSVPREPERDRTHAIKAEQRLAGMSLGSTLLAATILFLELPLLAHRIWLGNVSTLEMFVLGTLIALPVVLVTLLASARRLRGHVRDASLNVFPGEPRPGEPIGVVFVMKTRTPVRVTGVEITLESFGQGLDAKRIIKVHEDHAPRDVAAGEALRVEASLDLPEMPENDATSSRGESSAWWFAAKVTFEGLPTYRATFPLHVAEGAATA